MISDLFDTKAITPAQLRAAADALCAAGCPENTYLTRIYTDPSGNVIGWEQLGGQHT